MQVENGMIAYFRMRKSESNQRNQVSLKFIDI